MRWIAVGCVVCLFGAAVGALAQPPQKKLIEYGWDVPQPSYVADHIRDMEKRPFDGLIMRVSAIGGVFLRDKIDENDPALVKEFSALPKIAWDKFTDNFICMYSASTMDWFSDADWESVLQRARLCARAAKLGHCKGVCFDYEPYGDNPWQYSSQKQAKQKSFEEYAAQVRKRGGQFMDAMQAEYPGLVMHTFFQFSLFPQIATEPDEAMRTKELSQEGYGLLPYFINGLVDTAGPDVILTDGNEPSYYYQDPLSYFRVYHTIHQTVLGLVAPENHRKYRAQMQCAQALYVDYVFKYWPNGTPALYMTPQERATWWEHNVYYALESSDCYVWLYSEKMNWWTNENLPPGMEQAVINARDKIAHRRPLGFDMKDIMARAREREAEELRKKLGEQKKAEVAKLAPGQAPTIDGDLGDEAWKSVSALEAFMPYASQDDNSLKAKTLAWVAYDDQNLYLAVRCEEPNMNALHIVGAERDQPVWMGDSVDLFLAAGAAPLPFYHIILNANNVRWDARQEDAANEDLGWNPDYQTRTHKGPDFWSIEYAIPWSVLGVTPKPGTKLWANICRARDAGGVTEHSSWSRNVGGFVEPERFGVWVLK